jgi:adenine/guanine phosphoribosyltransferase-like PRPP-binding protein
LVRKGVSAIPGDRVLVVDDLDERILIATEH